MNEPIAPFFENKDFLNEKFIPICKEAVSRIREVDTNHVIILGAPQWNTNFKPVTDWSFDNNMMLTCHRYGGEANTDGIKEYIEFRDKTGLPMYMGEIGHNTMEWQSAYSSIMQENNIGYTYWPYKKRDIECMVAFDVPEDWDKIITPFANNKRGDFYEIRVARPNQEDAYKLMMELVENIKFENCHPLSDYINSMKLK